MSVHTPVWPAGRGKGKEEERGGRKERGGGKTGRGEEGVGNSRKNDNII